MSPSMEPSASKMTVRDLLEWAEESLRSASVPEADREALFMASAILGCKPLEVYLKRGEEADSKVRALFTEMLRRRRAREPGQYITGTQEFYGLVFRVGPGVLIPRPETELLVDEVLSNLRGNPSPRVLDLCTGSGAIAVTVAVEIKGAEVVAVDSSPEALRTARLNAGDHAVSGRIEFIESDLFGGLSSEVLDVFDIIVSNPPYISEAEFATLAPEVREHEPEESLLGGPDGLDFYRRIVPAAEGFLKAGGLLMVEVGYAQAELVERIFKDAGYLRSIELIEDLSGIKRVVRGRKTTGQP